MHGSLHELEAEGIPVRLRYWPNRLRPSPPRRLKCPVGQARVTAPCRRRVKSTALRTRLMPTFARATTGTVADIAVTSPMQNRGILSRFSLRTQAAIIGFAGRELERHAVRSSRLRSSTRLIVRSGCGEPEPDTRSDLHNRSTFRRSAHSRCPDHVQAESQLMRRRSDGLPRSSRRYANLDRIGDALSCAEPTSSGIRTAQTPPGSLLPPTCLIGSTHFETRSS